MDQKQAKVAELSPKEAIQLRLNEDEEQKNISHRSLYDVKSSMLMSQVDHNKDIMFSLESDLSVDV